MQNFRAYKRKWWKLNDTNSHYSVSISSHQSQNKQTDLFIAFFFFFCDVQTEGAVCQTSHASHIQTMFPACTGLSFLPAPQAYALVATSRSAWRTEKARSKKLSVSKPEEQALWIPLCRSDICLRFAGFWEVFHVPPSLAYGLGCPPNEVCFLVLNRQQQIWLWTGASSSHRQLLSKSWHHQGCLGAF